MKRRERYLFRAASLREIKAGMDDPLGQSALEAMIQVLEEAAAEFEQGEAGSTLH